MNIENNLIKSVEAYLDNSLSKQEVELLNQKIATDKQFAKEFEECIELVKTLKLKGQQSQFKQSLKEIKLRLDQEEKDAPRKISLRKHYIRTAAVAAGVALIASITTTFWNNKTQNTSSKYSELKKVRTEIEGIKKSQNRIINDLNNKANKPAIENKYSGTGFALSNDGYLVTNYHVTKGADSLYIQTREGDYFKAYTVSFDENADIAILKVESKNFKFSKQGTVPYSFSNSKSNLGEKIFTLGYPQDEIVYCEGYVSSRNGYLGDSMQYRLELPAEPGQSGAPIIDGNGSIVGIVTGKDSKSIGTTYAVSSKTMMRILSNLPEASNIKLPKYSKLAKMSRSQQIEKIQDFTCVVNVYK